MGGGGEEKEFLCSRSANVTDSQAWKGRWSEIPAGADKKPCILLGTIHDDTNIASI